MRDGTFPILETAMRRADLSCLRTVALVLAGVVLPSWAKAADVPKWSTYDVGLVSSTNYANGYASGPTLSATFTGPGGVTQIVSGFWNGNSAFIIRFTPIAEGSWNYTTRSSDPSLNGRSGTINATAPRAGDHGFFARRSWPR